MKVSINDPDAVQYIGRHGICNKKIKALITGIAKMPWGLAFVGYTSDGTAWCSRNPYVVEETPDPQLRNQGANEPTEGGKGTTTKPDPKPPTHHGELKNGNT